MLPPCLPPFPPSIPSPSPSHTSPLQVSPSLTESPKNRLHTIPVTISNKAEQGEGRDAPWHLNQWLSYNNSMIFNLSLLPPSLQTPRQHTGVYFPEKRKKISSRYLFWYFRPDGKNGALMLKQPNAVMLLVLKFKWGDLAVGVSCLLMLHPEISICKQCV